MTDKINAALVSVRAFFKKNKINRTTDLKHFKIQLLKSYFQKHFKDLTNPKLLHVSVDKKR